MWQPCPMTGNGRTYGMAMENPSPGGKSLHLMNIWTGHRYLQNSNAYPIFSAMSNQIVPVSMFPDVGRWLKQCWRTHLQVEKSLHWAHLRTGLRSHGNSKAFKAFLTMSGPVEHVLMFPNVDWWPRLCSCWTPTAPGGKITPSGISNERKEISSKFQNLSPHFRPCPTQWTHCRHCPMPHVYHRWKISWKTSSRWKNSFIGVGQLVKTGPVVSGVDGNVGVGFGISMISLPSPEILPMEWFFHLENLFSNVIFTCCHQVMSTQAWHGQVWSK